MKHFRSKLREKRKRQQKDDIFVLDFETNPFYGTYNSFSGVDPQEAFRVADVIINTERQSQRRDTVQRMNPPIGSIFYWDYTYNGTNNQTD